MDTKSFFMYYVIVFICFSLAGQLFSSGAGYDYMDNETLATYDEITIFNPEFWHYNGTGVGWSNIPVIGGAIDELAFYTGQFILMLGSLLTFDIPWIPAAFEWVRWIICIPFWIALFWVAISYVRGTGD